MYHTLVHRLCFWCCVLWKKHKLHSFQTFNNWMRKKNIYNKNNFSIFLFKLFIKLLYLFIEKENVHPTFLLWLITAWKAFDSLKASLFHQFTDYKHWELPSSSSCSCHSCQANFTMFTTTTEFLAFHVQGFFWEGLGRAGRIY